MKSKIIKSTTFSDRLKITRILLDASREVIFIGKFFNLDTGKYQPYQMICEFHVFMELVNTWEATHPKLFNLITEITPDLSAETFIIGRNHLPKGGLVLSDAIFVFGAMEFYSDIEGRFVYKFQDPDAYEETKVMVQINDTLPSIPTKLNLSEPTLALFDQIPFKSPFDPRQHWIKEINDNPRFMPFANLVYHLQIKYHYYLRLRHLGETHKAAKFTCGIRELRVFNLAKTIYNLTSGSQ